MKTRRTARAITYALLAVTMLTSAIASAQTYQGTVRGLVRDAQGVIPSVDVTLINEDTNAERTVVSNEVGEYVFSSVLPGTYTVRATLVGFRTEERKGMRLATQQQLVQDFTLEVGGLTEQITVTGVSPLIERSSATMATSLGAKDIAALPIFGRNTFYSAISTPNVIQTGDPQFVRYQDQSNASFLSLGGGPRRGNAYLVEGVSITDFVNRPSWTPSTESLEDMRVQVKTYDADMGRAAGGVFNVTARSGSNQWRGSALFLNKPEWASGQLFFAKRAGSEKPPQYYYSWAGSVGGPVVRDRTFFWFSKDDYAQRSTRNNVVTVPTALERQGDFSQSRNAAGQLIVIYDPLTTRPNATGTGFIRDPFPGNVIPADRLNPVTRAMLANMPFPTSARAFNGQATLDDGPQSQETLKVDQRWSGSWTTTGMYGHQHTQEPGSAFWGAHGTVPGDPGGGKNDRVVHFLALNNIFIPDNRTTVAVRYGYNRFQDNGGYYLGFDAGSLGFPASYTAALPFNTYPNITLTGFSNIGNNGPSLAMHISQTTNATVTRLAGSHSLKFGADYRRIEAQALVYGSSAGAFTFNQGFTQGPTPTTASAASGDAVASFLLGYPASGEINSATPGTFLINYYSAYLQDDYRISSKLTANFGLRYEYEPGISEANNGITVGFDRTAAFPIQLPGLDLRGGLIYAGVNGNPTHQAQPLNGLAPRGGLSWSPTDKTVLRGGYGLFWAPTMMPNVSEAVIGTRGYSAATTYLASTDGNLTPSGSISDPFPNGVVPPQGNALGLLTGAGGVVDFADPASKPGYVQQYSLDYQREMPGNSVLSFGYMGSRSERLSLGGTSDATVNINQLAPEYLALGTGLQQLVPNPFFGIAAFGNLSRAATISQGQLLRPYPQFDNVLMHRVNQARARYNAVVTRWNKRMAQGYALDVNYTFSRLEDNQFGESNSFSNRQGSALDNYDLDREYGVSLLDVAHRLNVNATFELPFGEGRHWFSGSGPGRALLGGWLVTVAGRYQTGFPLNISQSSNNSGLLGSNQRPNLVPGAEVMTTGSQVERAVSGWINPAAFTAAPAFTFGDVPRTSSEWRGPGQRTTDLAISKTQRVGGKSVSLRVDILNVFDDPLFIGPVTTFGTANFGQITNVGGFARSMQFQVRLGW
jgi:hypothetical protein